jgi:hypothetical protein
LTQSCVDTYAFGEKENSAFQSKTLAHFGRGRTTAVVGEGHNTDCSFTLKDQARLD